MSDESMVIVTVNVSRAAAFHIANCIAVGNETPDTDELGSMAKEAEDAFRDAALMGGDEGSYAMHALYMKAVAEGRIKPEES